MRRRILVMTGWKSQLTSIINSASSVRKSLLDLESGLLFDIEEAEQILADDGLPPDSMVTGVSEAETGTVDAELTPTAAPARVTPPVARRITLVAASGTCRICGSPIEPTGRPRSHRVLSSP